MKRLPSISGVGLLIILAMLLSFQNCSSPNSFDELPSEDGDSNNGSNNGNNNSNGPRIVYALSSNGSSISTADISAVLYTRVENVSSSDYAVAVPANSQCPTFDPNSFKINSADSLRQISFNSFESTLYLVDYLNTSGIRSCAAKVGDTSWTAESVLSIRAPRNSLTTVAYFSSDREGQNPISSVQQNSIAYSIVVLGNGNDYRVCIAGPNRPSSAGNDNNDCSNSEPNNGPQWTAFTNIGEGRLSHCDFIDNPTNRIVSCKNDMSIFPKGFYRGYVYNIPQARKTYGAGLTVQ